MPDMTRRSRECWRVEEIVDEFVDEIKAEIRAEIKAAAKQKRRARQCNRPIKQFDYQTYLLSEAWKSRRQVALKAAGYRCRICNSQSQLDVHHRTYKRIGHEDQEDLTVLCHRCHFAFHDLLKKQATKKQQKKAKIKPIPSPKVLSKKEKFRQMMERYRRERITKEHIANEAILEMQTGKIVTSRRRGEDHGQEEQEELQPG